MYHVGPSDGAVSRYILGLEIYDATSVFYKHFNETIAKLCKNLKKYAKVL